MPWTQTSGLVVMIHCLPKMGPLRHLPLRFQLLQNPIHHLLRLALGRTLALPLLVSTLR